MDIRHRNQPLAGALPARPQRPQRPFTDADLRRQRELLIHGGTWEDQYDIPPRPWSPQIEAFCESVRHDLEMSDWQAEQERLAGLRAAL